MQEQRGCTSVRQYRGKRLDNGEWIFGWRHVIDTLGKGYTGTAIQVQHGTARPFSVQVDPTTVGQYTGLKDRNDKWIYEGDIVERKVKSINYSDSFNVAYCEVFRNVQGAYRIKGKGIYETELYSERKNVEVIGNIHDNPELLEVPHE